VNLFGLTFANPALLVGALALFIPYAVHLLTRRTPRRIVFPTLQFLQKAQANQSRLFRLRHLLLMVLRTAFILLLLMAFLRPAYFENQDGANVDPDATTAHIIVLDASASMGYQAGGFSPFARGQRLAEEILDQVGGDDTANLILAGRMPKASFPQPSANQFHLKRDLQSAEATFERGDIDAAIAVAIRQLAPLDGIAKRIHFISDFQRTNWAAVNFSEMPSDIETTFIGVGDSDGANIAVTSLSLRPATPALGEPVELTAEIANYSGRSDTVTVQLAFDDQAPLRREVVLRPHAVATAEFRFRANAAGSFEATVSVPVDGLTADDSRFAALDVSERVQVLVISDADTSGRESSVRYLVRALSPSEGGVGAPDVRVVRSSDATEAIRSDTGIMILDAVAGMPDRLAERLHERVTGGGALIHFLSGRNERTIQEQLVAHSGDEWPTPLKLNTRIRMTSGEFSRLAQANFDDVLLKKFRESDDLREIEFYSYHGTDRVPGVGQVLMRYNDENVAMARASHGQGMVLTCNFSAGQDDSDLSKRTIFVPLVQEMMKSCRIGSERVDFLVGQPASLIASRSESSGGFRFTGPGGIELSASVEQRETEAAVLFSRTAAPGFYRAMFNGERLASAAVNLDSRESDLSVLSPEQVEQLAEGTRATVLAGDKAGVEALGQMFEGRPLWHLFAAAAMALLMLELALQWVWRR